MLYNCQSEFNKDMLLNFMGIMLMTLDCLKGTSGKSSLLFAIYRIGRHLLVDQVLDESFLHS